MKIRSPRWKENLCRGYYRRCWRWIHVRDLQLLTFNAHDELEGLTVSLLSDEVTKIVKGEPAPQKKHTRRMVCISILGIIILSFVLFLLLLLWLLVHRARMEPDDAIDADLDNMKQPNMDWPNISTPDEALSHGILVGAFFGFSYLNELSG